MARQLNSTDSISIITKRFRLVVPAVQPINEPPGPIVKKDNAHFIIVSSFFLFFS
jgi:hypothetical protein